MFHKFIEFWRRLKTFTFTSIFIVNFDAALADKGFDFARLFNKGHLPRHITDKEVISFQVESIHQLFDLDRIVYDDLVLFRFTLFQKYNLLNI